MSRRIRILVLRGEYSSNEVVTILDVSVPGMRIVILVRQHLPSKQVGIEFSSPLRIPGAEVRPAKRAVYVLDSDSVAFLRLPNRKDGAGGVLNHRHSSQRSHIKRLSADLAAKL